MLLATTAAEASVTSATRSMRVILLLPALLAIPYRSHRQKKYTFLLKIPVWWRRAVLIPPLGCPCSFFFSGSFFLSLGVETRVATAGFEAAECMPPCWGHVWEHGNCRDHKIKLQPRFFLAFFVPGRRRATASSRTRHKAVADDGAYLDIATELQNALSTTQEVPAPGEVLPRLSGFLSGRVNPRGEPRRDCVSCSHSRLEVPRQACAP